MNIRAISVIVTFLLCVSSVALGEDWHKVALPFCSQVKAKGAKVGGRQFAVYRAANAEIQCCTNLPLQLKGKTERFGYFKLSGLNVGRYFVVFDLKTRQAVVPLFVERVLNYKDCEPQSRIVIDKEGKLKWEEWITVD